LRLELNPFLPSVGPDPGGEKLGFFFGMSKKTVDMDTPYSALSNRIKKPTVTGAMPKLGSVSFFDNHMVFRCGAQIAKRRER